MKFLRRLVLVNLLLFSWLVPFSCTDKVEPDLCQLYFKDTFFAGIDADIIRPKALNATNTVVYSSFPYGLLVAQGTGEMNIRTSQGGIYRVTAEYEANQNGRTVQKVCNMLLRVNNIYYGGDRCVDFDLDTELSPLLNGDPVSTLPPRTEFDTPPANEISALQQGLVINRKTGVMNLYETMQNISKSGLTEQKFTLYYRIGDNLNNQRIEIIFTIIGSSCNNKLGGRIEKPGLRVRVSSI